MSLSYQDTFLVDCSAVNSISNNGEMWVNKINTLQLNPNDTITIQNAYINQIGGSSESISIEGGNPNDLVSDNKCRITIIPYLNATGNNMVALPASYSLSNLQRNGIMVRESLNNQLVNPNSVSVDFTGFLRDKGQFTYDNHNNPNRPYYSTFCYCNIASLTFNGVRTLDRLGVIQDGKPTDLKTYLSSAISQMNGDRHTAMVWDNNNYRYIYKEITIDIDIPLGNYSPANLASFLSNNLSLTNDNQLENVLDEDNNKCGYFFNSKCCYLDYCLYECITDLNHKQGDTTQSYPHMSPITTLGQHFSQHGNRQTLFSPTQENYYSLGSNNNKLEGNYNSYGWIFSFTDPDNNVITPTIFFKYPRTLYHSQLVNDNKIIDFNVDAKTNQATINNAVINRGDTGYILTSLRFTDDNILKIKNMFDSQLIEQNIDNLYCYDFVNHPNPTNRTQSVKGNSNLHRWINVGIRNNVDSSQQGGFTELKDKQNTLIYPNNSNTNINLQFGSDWLGKDSEMVAPSTNIDYFFSNYAIQGGFTSIGNINVNGSATGMENTNYGQFNSDYDISCRNTKYIPLPQLIKIKQTFTDDNGNVINIKYPTPLTDEYKNINYGYCEKYVGQDGLDYIMLEVDNSCGGSQSPVLNQQIINGVNIPNQNLFFCPFFSTYGNQAISRTNGNGANLSPNTKFDTTKGNIDISSYGKSIIQSGIGAPKPTIAFSNEESRYFFSNFYTPCFVSNKYGEETADIAGFGNEVLQFNYDNSFYQRVITGLTQYPYQDNSIANTYGNDYYLEIYNSFSYTLPYDLGLADHNSSVYYQEGGIMIMKFVENLDNNPPILETEDNFNKSIFFKLGFRWNQFNSTFTDKNYYTEYIKRNTLTINQQGVINKQFRNSNWITNNSDLINTANDTLLYVNRDNFGLMCLAPSNNVNSFNIVSQSTEFYANSLPIKTENAYYIVCSNILNTNKYYTNELLNGIDIVEKTIANDDFYYSAGSVVHTINRPYTINQVAHTIKKPNLVNIQNNNFSSVIYRIVKTIIVGYTPSQMENLETIQEQEVKLVNKMNKKQNKVLSNKQILLNTIMKQRLLKGGEKKNKKETEEGLEDDNEEEEEELPLEDYDREDLVDLQDLINVNEDRQMEEERPIEDFDIQSQENIVDNMLNDIFTLDSGGVSTITGGTANTQSQNIEENIQMDNNLNEI